MAFSAAALREWNMLPTDLNGCACETHFIEIEGYSHGQSV